MVPGALAEGDILAYERVLVPRWIPELIVLSFCTTWLGSYTTFQLLTHASYVRTSLMRWLSIAMGSLIFGFCAIWSMHFLGMLACRLDVEIKFDIPLTVLSAVVAVTFTFAATFTTDSSPLYKPSRPRPASPTDIEAPVSTSLLYDPELSSDEEEQEDMSDIRTEGEHFKLLMRGQNNIDTDLDYEVSSDTDDAHSFLTFWLYRGRRFILRLTIRAAIWAFAVIFMHYGGMWAMIIPHGRIEWHPIPIILSCMVAFVVTFVACILMFQMEFHFGRQLASSIIAASGVCSMHYIGMAAATFHTRAPPSPNAGYPPYLPFLIISIAVVACVVSNAVLANSAVISRNRMVETIQAKRRIWKLLAEKEAALRSNALKQQFISVASHEIRTPLHTVNGYAELLSRTDLTPEQVQYVNNIQQACHAINVIAGNVLDFSKLERDNVESDARPVLVEPRKMLEAVARMAGGAIDTEQDQNVVENIISVAPEVPSSIYIDETYALRILMNLFSNAQKFTESGYISVSLSLEHPTSSSSNTTTPTHLIACVSDSGCGIPTRLQKDVFLPFRQADNSLTRTHQGTGLGLTIVRHLVQRMGGSITVDSRQGVGSTFTVRMPFQPGSASSPPSPASSSSSQDPLLSLEWDTTIENGGAGPSKKKKKRRRRVVRVVLNAPRKEEVFLRRWEEMGCEATSAPLDMDADGFACGADVVWTDVANLRESEGLRELLRRRNQAQIQQLDPFADDKGVGPALCVVLSAREQLQGLVDDVHNLGPRVYLINRPVIMHEVVQLLDSSSLSRTTSETADLLSNGRPLGDDSLASLQPEEGENSSGLVVLLVEDNLVNQRLGKRLIEKLGHTVVTANDGQEAINAIKRVKCDICLMDCQMPVLDGFAATRKIREMEASGSLPRRHHIVALTANVSSDAAAACREAGMDNFLPKPLTLSDLETALQGLS